MAILGRVSVFNKDRSSIYSFAKKVNKFLLKRFGYKRDLTCVIERTISIHSAKVHLYLRFKAEHFWPANTIVLANIGFKEQRKGHGSAMLSLLVNLAHKYHFEYVGIESAFGGESIESFLKKYGFTRLGRAEQKCWLVGIQSLESALTLLPCRYLQLSP